jgi:hypothetical protein
MEFACISQGLTFVVPDTPLVGEFLAGQYQPPSFPLVTEAVAQIAPRRHLTVGMWGEGLSPLAVSSADPNNLPRIVNALQRFNITQRH